MTNDAALAPLIESYLDLRWHFDPVQATAAGRMEHDHRLGRFGGQEIKEYVAALRALANAVEELPLEELDDELDRTALLNEIRVSVHRFERERPHVRNPEYWLSHILQGLYFLLVRGDRPAPQEHDDDLPVMPGPNFQARAKVPEVRPFSLSLLSDLFLPHSGEQRRLCGMRRSRSVPRPIRLIDSSSQSFAGAVPPFGSDAGNIGGAGRQPLTFGDDAGRERTPSLIL